MDASRARAASIVMMARSSARSVDCNRFLRHSSEQYLIDSQFFAHFARHAISRPHRAHTFDRRSGVGSLEPFEQRVPTEHCALDAHGVFHHALQRLDITEFHIGRG